LRQAREPMRRSSLCREGWLAQSTGSALWWLALVELRKRTAAMVRASILGGDRPS
jgi:hypothetical protein